MDVKKYEQLQNDTVTRITNKYGVTCEAIDDVLSFAGSLGHYLIGYDLYQEAFHISDGETYTLHAIRS
ncbi:hypothetical protein [Lysinibacillus sp. 54212]|uniref:hypothetical protein n=1 Tax=Lysinibacillus sp. 54212 TaxID=3119829 RepID=UPI002FC78284